MPVQQGPPSKPVAPAPHPSHVAAVVAPQGPASQTPKQFAATQTAKTQSSLDQYLTYLSTNMGRLAGQQATQELNAETSPLLSGLTQQQAASGQAITGYTQQLAQQLAGITPGIQAAYQQAEQQQNALDQSLASSLSGAGSTAAADLTSTLAARGQNTTPAAALGTFGAGIANASYGTGSASLANLFASGAAENAFGAQLPGIAALSGLQALKQSDASFAQQRSQVLSDAQAKYPTLVNQAVNQLETQQRNLITQANNETNQSLAKQKLAQAGKLAQLADQIRQQTANTSATNAATNQTRAANTAAYQQGQLGLGAARVKVAQQNANTAAYRAQIAQENALTAQARAAKAAKAKGKLTAAQHSALLAKASKLAAVYYNGVPAKQRYNTTTGKFEAVPGTGQDFIPYATALGRLTAAGLSRADALTVLNSYYQPGEGGRPLGPKAARLQKTIGAGGTTLFGPGASGLGFGG